MPVQCGVDSCNSKQELGRSFFRCPKDNARCENWKRILGFVGTHRYANLTPEECNARIKICDLHFPKESYMKTNLKTHLLHNAVPSLNLLQNGDVKDLKDISIQTEKDDVTYNSIALQTEDTQDDVKSYKDVSLQTCVFARDKCTQTLAALSANSPRKKRLREEIKTLKMAGTPTSSKKRKCQMETGITIEDVHKYLENNYPEKSCNLLKTQLDLLNKSPKGCRCQQWKDNLGFIGEHKYASITSEQAYKSIKICSTHFKEDSFFYEKRLSKTSVPSKLLPENLDQNLQKYETVRTFAGNFSKNSNVPVIFIDRETQTTEELFEVSRPDLTTSITGDNLEGLLEHDTTLPSKIETCTQSGALGEFMEDSTPISLEETPQNQDPPLKEEFIPMSAHTSTSSKTENLSVSMNKSNSQEPHNISFEDSSNIMEYCEVIPEEIYIKSEAGSSDNFMEAFSESGNVKVEKCKTKNENPGIKSEINSELMEYGEPKWEENNIKSEIGNSSDRFNIKDAVPEALNVKPDEFENIYSGEKRMKPDVNLEIMGYGELKQEEIDIKSDSDLSSDKFEYRNPR